MTSARAPEITHLLESLGLCSAFQGLAQLFLRSFRALEELLLPPRRRLAGRGSRGGGAGAGARRPSASSPCRAVDSRPRSSCGRARVCSHVLLFGRPQRPRGSA